MIYCVSCGAANVTDAERCFACQQSLDEENPPTKPAPPLLHERYHVLAQVGTGGFGEVYKAVDTLTEDRTVAIKRINLKGLRPQEVIDATNTFNREVELLSQLAYPHLPHIYEHFTDPEHWYLIMEFIEGQTLEQYLRKCGGALPVEETLEIGLQVCSVLDYLHTRQPPVIFRDLKPANIMLTPSKLIYLIDFGTARLFKPGKLRDTIAFGSPGYAAPEQYGKAQTTPRSDLYSLGATLHCLLSGDDPSDSPFHFAPLATRQSPIPPELVQLVAQMVELDASQRPESAVEVRQALQELASERRLFPLSVPSARSFTSATPPPSDWAVNAPTVQQAQIQLGLPPTPTDAPHVQKTITRRVVVASMVTVAVGGGIVGISALFPRGVADPNTAPSIVITGNTPEAQPVTDIYDNITQTDAVLALDWSRWGVAGQIVSVCRDNTVAVWNVDSAQQLAKQTFKSVLSVDWSPDGKQLVIGGNDGLISILTPDLHVSVSNTTSNVAVQAVKWSYDGRSVATGGNGTLTIWQLPMWHSVAYTSSVGTTSAVSWSSDDTLIAVAQFDGVDILNVQTGQRTSYPELHSHQPVYGVAFSPVRNVGASSSDNVILVWNPATGTIDLSYVRHTRTVRAIAWSPDGKYIASAGDDKTVQVWDPLTGELRYTYTGHTDTVTSVAWSADGRRIASGSADKTVQVWASGIPS